MSKNEEWRKIAKFPSYEIAEDQRIRSTLTNRFIGQRQTANGPMVLLHRNGWNTECFVNELYLSAFPESRTSENKYVYVPGLKRVA